MTRNERDQGMTSTISYDQFGSDSQAEILKPSRWNMLKPDFSRETIKIADYQVCGQKALRSRLRLFLTGKEIANGK